jgi:hypothetical protein
MIDVEQFMQLAREEITEGDLVGRIILDRLPFTFESKKQYFQWRAALAEGIQVDPRDIILVGSAATGRSLSPGKRFKVFDAHSDVDIAVLSPTHFEQSWQWFRSADPVILGLDPDERKLFDQHQKQYVFDGMIAANYFLSYLPFGNEWNRELQRAERYLPPKLRGRKQSVRIYKSSEALRRAQAKSLIVYQNYLRVKDEARESN